MGYSTVLLVLSGLLLQLGTIVHSQSLNIQAVGQSRPAAPQPQPPPVYQPPQYYPQPAAPRPPPPPPPPQPSAVETMSDMELMMMTSSGGNAMGLFNQILFREGKMTSNSIPESMRTMYHFMTMGRCPRQQTCSRRPACTSPTMIYDQQSGCPQCPVCPFQVLEKAVMSLLQSHNPIRLFTAQKIVKGMSELPARYKRKPVTTGMGGALAKMLGLPPTSPAVSMLGLPGGAGAGAGTGAGAMSPFGGMSPFFGLV